MLSISITQFLAFVLIHVLVFLSAVRITDFLFVGEKSSRSLFTVSVFTTGISHLLLVLQIFGMLNHFSFWWICFGLLSSSGVILFLLRKMKGHFVFSDTSKIPWWLFLLIIPSGLLFLLMTTQAISLPPMEIDSLSYHLPFAMEWISTHSIWSIPYTAFAGPVGYYPGNNELITAWLMSPFSGTQLIGLQSLFSAVFLSLTTYGILRYFSIQRFLAVVLSLAFFSFPVVAHQIGTQLNDLFFVATFGVAFLFSLLFWRKPSFSSALLFGLGTGLCFGTKYLALPILVVPGLIMFCGLFQEKARNYFGRYFSLAFLSSLATGGIWYVRNFIDNGNPMYPSDVSVFGKVIFHGYAGFSEKTFPTSLFFTARTTEKFFSFLHDFSGMIGWIGIIILGLASLLSLFDFGKSVLFFMQKKRAFPLLHWLGMLSMVAFLLVVYVVSPYSGQHVLPNVRYAMPALFMAVISIGFFLREYKKTSFIIGVSLFAVLVLQLWSRIVFDIPMYEGEVMLALPILRNAAFPFFVFLFSVLCLGYGAYRFLFFRKEIFWKNLIALGLFTIGFSALIFNTVVLADGLKWETAKDLTHHTTLQSLFSLGAYFDDLPATQIAYSGFSSHFSLYGRNLQHTVQYVNTDGCEDCRYGDYGKNAGSIRENADYEKWKNLLLKKGINYLVLAPYELGIRSFEFEWAKAHPEFLHPVWNEQNVWLYEVED